MQDYVYNDLAMTDGLRSKGPQPLKKLIDYSVATASEALTAKIDYSVATATETESQYNTLPNAHATYGSAPKLTGAHATCGELPGQRECVCAHVHTRARSHAHARARTHTLISASRLFACGRAVTHVLNGATAARPPPR